MTSQQGCQFSAECNAIKLENISEIFKIFTEYILACILGCMSIVFNVEVFRCGVVIIGGNSTHECCKQGINV